MGLKKVVNALKRWKWSKPMSRKDDNGGGGSSRDRQNKSVSSPVSLAASASASSSPSPRDSQSESRLRFARTPITREQQISDLKRVFNKFDANSDGKICREEFSSLMSSLGYHATENEVSVLFAEADRDGDGFIDETEFIEMNLATDGEGETDVKALRDAFQIFDLDGNGSISLEELFQVLDNIGEPSSIEDCRQMIARVDCDGNGQIEFEEFKLMMTTIPV